MAGTAPNGGSIEYRVREAENDIRDIRAELRGINAPVLLERLTRVAEDLREFRRYQTERDKEKDEEMRGFRRAILSVGGTLVVGLVVLILTLASGS